MNGKKRRFESAHLHNPQLIINQLRNLQTHLHTLIYTNCVQIQQPLIFEWLFLVNVFIVKIGVMVARTGYNKKKRSEIASLSVGAEGVEPPTLCL